MTMVGRTLVCVLSTLVLTAGVVSGTTAGTSRGQANADAAFVLGTWAGRSICVGNRPACKNEDVVYRILPVDGKPGLVTLLGDKIIDGKRVPMGALEFTYKRADRSLTCDFRRGNTHAVWSFTVSGDLMTGTLVILPSKELGRRVSVHRVGDDQVPKAPGRDECGAAVPRGWLTEPQLLRG